MRRREITGTPAGTSELMIFLRKSTHDRLSDGAKPQNASPRDYRSPAGTSESMIYAPKPVHSRLSNGSESKPRNVVAARLPEPSWHLRIDDFLIEPRNASPRDCMLVRMHVWTYVYASPYVNPYAWMHLRMYGCISIGNVFMA